MTTAPYLVEEDGEWRLDVSTGRSGRRRFGLSDRAEALLVDDLAYGNRDVVPWVTTRTLVLAGGAFLPGKGTDARERSWSITGAGTGRRATDEVRSRRDRTTGLRDIARDL